MTSFRKFDSDHIVEVLRLGLDPQTCAKDITWPKSENFEEMSAILIAHGLVGFYEWALKKSDFWQDCPLELQERIQYALSSQWTMNMHLAALQDHVSDLLEKENLQFLILKGLPLSERLYDNAMIRATSDVDVLLPKSQWTKGLALLKKNGFVERKGRKHFHLALGQEKFPGILELHWNVSDQRFQFSIEDIFTRCQRQRISGRDLLVMDPMDELLYLTAHHAVNYLLFRWQCLLDVNRFVQVHGKHLDWQEVRRRMQAWGLQRSTPASLLYCSHYFVQVWAETERQAVEKIVNESSKSIAAFRIMRGLADWHKPFSSPIHRSRLARKAVEFLMGMKI